MLARDDFLHGSIHWSDTVMQASDQFLSVLSEFSRSVGLPDQADVQGIEFAAGDYTVVVFPHPVRPDSLVAEVVVHEVDPGSPTAAVLFRALHLLNESARFDHDWQITVSPENAILIYTIRPIGQTSAPDLEALLCDGIERAEALREVITGLIHGADADTQTRSVTPVSDSQTAATGGYSPAMLRA
jgi:hypothetical protein